MSADLLVPAPSAKTVRDEDKIRAAAAAAAAAAGGAAPGPPPAPTKTFVVYPALPRFTLDDRQFLIVQEDVECLPFGKSGYWLVSHCTDGTMQRGSVELGRPESVTEKLMDELKSADWGVAYVDMDPEPDRDFARLHLDFEKTKGTDFKVGFDFIKARLDRAEDCEYKFALRMQGLLNCGLNAVWTCTEFGFDNADRSHIMEQFLQKYIGRFLAQVGQKAEEMDPDKIVREALQMHSRFSAGWTKEHKKGLSPTLDACSEALVGHFCDGPLRFLVEAGLTRKEIARFLRRDESLSAQFGMCLHFFMVKLEQDKNGRNANYKSMFNSTTSQLLHMRALGDFLKSKAPHMATTLASLNTPDLRRFHPLTMDWYYVVSQLHAPSVQYTGVKRSRTRMARDAPGMFFRQST